MVNVMKANLHIQIILLLFFSNSFAFRISDFPVNFNTNKLLRVQEKLQNGESISDAYFSENFLKSIIPEDISQLLRNETFITQLNNGTLFQNLQISTRCEQHYLIFLLELFKAVQLQFLEIETWALHMIDSWGRIPNEGILSGHLNSYGDWSECTNIKANVRINEQEDSFRGQYVWVYLLPYALIDFGFGSESEKSVRLESSLFDEAMERRGIDHGSPIESKQSVSIPELIEIMLKPAAAGFVFPSKAYCVPDSCSIEDSQAFLEAIFSVINPVTYPIATMSRTNEFPPMDDGTKTMIGVLSVLGLLMLIGSLLDTILTYKKNQEMKSHVGVQVLLAFSVPNNIKKWQNTKTDGGFSCIHGMRFLSTCWVLLCHTVFLLILQGPSWNIVDLNYIYKRSWPIYFILNGYFSVDTFFTMSGLLACYSILKSLDKTRGRLNVPMLYLHRYIRITPTYALIIGCLATLFPYFGTAPFYAETAKSISEMCRKFWWHNLLYVNNVITYNDTIGESMCEGESWYIANDMQFFIISPIFVFLLWKWKILGMLVLSGACVASILAPAIVVGTERLLPTQIFWKSEQTPNPRSMQIYQQPQYRIGPYLVGIWMGYFLFKIGRKPVKLPKLVVIGGWMASTATALALIVGVIPYFDPENDDNYVWSGVYAGLSRFVWGLVICWIIFACVKGYGGWVNSFLSWKIFIPLGRLTFCVYLSSLSVQMRLQMSFLQPFVFDFYSVVNMFFSHLIMCFIVGWILTMAFESPFIALEKILFASSMKNQRDVNPKAENNPPKRKNSKDEFPIPNVSNINGDYAIPRVKAKAGETGES